MLKQTALDTTLEQFGLQSTGNLKQNLLMILKSDKIDTIFDYMKDAKILEHILPEFIPCIGLDQRTPHHCYTVDKHILAVVKNINANPKLVGYDKDILLIKDGEYGQTIQDFFARYDHYTFAENTTDSIDAVIKNYLTHGVPERKPVADFRPDRIAENLISGL